MNCKAILAYLCLASASAADDASATLSEQGPRLGFLSSIPRLPRRGHARDLEAAQEPRVLASCQICGNGSTLQPQENAGFDNDWYSCQDAQDMLDGGGAELVGGCAGAQEIWAFACCDPYPKAYHSQGIGYCTAGGAWKVKRCYVFSDTAAADQEECRKVCDSDENCSAHSLRNDMKECHIYTSAASESHCQSLLDSSFYSVSAEARNVDDGTDPSKINGATSTSNPSFPDDTNHCMRKGCDICNGAELKTEGFSYDEEGNAYACSTLHDYVMKGGDALLGGCDAIQGNMSTSACCAGEHYCDLCEGRDAMANDRNAGVDPITGNGYSCWELEIAMNNGGLEAAGTDCSGIQAFAGGLCCGVVGANSACPICAKDGSDGEIVENRKPGLDPNNPDVTCAQMQAFIDGGGVAMLGGCSSAQNLLGKCCSAVEIEQCDICDVEAGKEMMDNSIAGTDQGNEYTCRDAQNYLDSQGTAELGGCDGAKAFWGPPCCKEKQIEPCDICGTYSVAKTVIAGQDEEGKDYTCEEAQADLNTKGADEVAGSCNAAKDLWWSTCCGMADLFTCQICGGKHLIADAMASTNLTCEEAQAQIDETGTDAYGDCSGAQGLLASACCSEEKAHCYLCEYGQELHFDIIAEIGKEFTCGAVQQHLDKGVAGELSCKEAKERWSGACCHDWVVTNRSVDTSGYSSYSYNSNSDVSQASDLPLSVAVAGVSFVLATSFC